LLCSFLAWPSARVWLSLTWLSLMTVKGLAGLAGLVVCSPFLSDLLFPGGSPGG
jgi:hypothetical protein